MKTKLTKIITIIVCMAVLLIGCGNNNAQAVEQYNLGMQYLTESKYEEAVLTFTKAIEIDEKYAEAYIGRADAYIGLGGSENTANAVKDYVTASDIYIEQNNPEKAEEVLNGALDKVGDNEEINNKLEQVQNGNSQNTNSSNSSDSTTGNKEKLEDEYYPNGNIKVKYEYYEDGTVKIKQEYDEKGYLIKINIYNPDSSLNCYRLLKNNEEGLMIELIEYGVDDEVQYYNRYEYDVNKNLIKSNTYNKDNIIIYYNIYENDSNGNIRKQIGYNSNDSIDFIRTYDENGNIIEESHYNPDGTIRE